MGDVHLIDGIQTILTKVRGNIAQGFILQADLTTRKCVVAKVGNHFAHGETAKGAIEDAQAKHNDNLDPAERIALFWNQFNRTDSYPGHEFFVWHKTLTGSCLTGREQFVRDRGIDLDKKYTVAEFIEIVKNAYDPCGVMKRLMDGNAN